MIRLHGLSLRAGGGKDSRIVLSRATTSVPQGGFRWLLGPSGSGKSTLLRTLALAHRPDAGHLEILGQDPARANRRNIARLRCRIGVIHQDARLLDALSLRENITLPLMLDRVPQMDRQAEVDAIINWLGLQACADQRPAQVSGGERQRAAIARALVRRPSLLLADEPTNALGQAWAEQLVTTFAELAGMGTTVVIATHNPTLPALVPAMEWHLNAQGHFHERLPEERRPGEQNPGETAA